MKYEWKKSEKEIYLPKEEPSLVDVPLSKYICIKGAGNPNKEDYQNRIKVLYSLSYAIRMMPKNSHTPVGYFEYTVYPLEGLWDLSEEGRLRPSLDKDELIYTIMIKQPDFVNEEVFKKAIEISYKKNPNPLLEEAYLDELSDAYSVQMLHVGPYDDENKTFNIMKDYIKENDLEIKTLVHKEIYISDPRKIESSKLKTVLRYSLIKK